MGLENFFKKLFIGDITKRENVRNNVIEKRVANLKAIWNNTHYNDSGIEEIFRLFLAAILFLFPSLYIKDAFKRYGTIYQELVTEAIVLFKVIFPLILLKTNLYQVTVCKYIMVWFMAETLIYIPSLIFASDTLETPRSFRRSMILLFLNYLEIIFAFAVLYFDGQYFNQPMLSKFDAIYFSFITSNTIGYGDFYPIQKTGKMLVTLQSMFYLSFIILFINFFSHRVRSKGYFEN